MGLIKNIVSGDMAEEKKRKKRKRANMTRLLRNTTPILTRLR